MKLNHVGLNVKSEEEIVNFYQNILGFHSEYQFELPAEMCDNIFGVNKQLKVYSYKRDDIFLELFIHSENPGNSFSHICLELEDRESIATKCEQSKYQVIRIKRVDRPDILFVKDKAGNIFELKLK